MYVYCIFNYSQISQHSTKKNSINNGTLTNSQIS